MLHSMNSGAGKPFPDDRLHQRLRGLAGDINDATFDPCAQKCSTTEAPMPLAAAGDEDGAVF